MRQFAGALLIGLVLGLAPAPAHAQLVIGGPVTTYRTAGYYSPPGYYGTTYGTPSYGLRRGYSSFASPYGPGYAYGYAPTGYLPGPYGAGIWAPRTVVARPSVNPGIVYGTYAVPYAPRGVAAPPIGMYAPAFGPGLPPQVWSYGR